MSILSRLTLAAMRAFFYLLYKPLARTYDWVASIVSLGHWNEWVLSSLPYLTGPRVLELGHGPGHLQLAMAQNGFAAVGLDASRQMGSIAYLRMRDSGFNSLVVNGYAQFMPFPANVFNQVVATFPAPFIVHPETISEIYRTLTPGGYLILLPAAWITGQRISERLAAWLFQVTGQAPLEDNPGLDDQMADPFRKAGFYVEVRRIPKSNATLLFVFAHKPGVPLTKPTGNSVNKELYSI